MINFPLKKITLLLLLMSSNHSLHALKPPTLRQTKDKLLHLACSHKLGLSIAAVCCVTIGMWRSLKRRSLILPGASYTVFVNTQDRIAQQYIGNVIHTYNDRSPQYRECLSEAKNFSRYILLFNREDMLITTVNIPDDVNSENAQLFAREYLDPASKPQGVLLKQIVQEDQWLIKIFSNTDVCIFKQAYPIEPDNVGFEGLTTINLQEIIPYCDIMLEKIIIHVPVTIQENNND